MTGYWIPQWLLVLVDIAAWGFFHAVTGYAAHRLDTRWLRRDGWLLRARRFESDGRWYRRTLRIHRWKDKVPEAGALFAGGISKKELPALTPAGLGLFAQETRRAELAHWWALCCSPLFILWNPLLPSVLLVTYGVLVNAPFIAIQRYNRFRTVALIERRAH